MFDWFSSKPDPKEEQRSADRQLRRAGREIERERHKLEQEEKKLELEIKKMAKEGNTEGAKLLAKQLVQMRKQKQRTYAANSKLQSIGNQNKAMGANVKLADALGVAGQSMAGMNKLMKPEKMAADMGLFAKESMKMDMTDEMINDTLDDMLTESGDEQESEDIIGQVLDEIGIEISGKMARAPNPHKEDVATRSKGLSDEDIEAQLAKLRS